ncbi:Transcription elongation regulator 1 [Araneus ventricosus]|uniref:Transcription elongation regulator 1 n=1 Tax=Araneus ventricosus TaxID=182803 RepID=A0A4Y2DBE8_ARAVE|nr:Transcription elongation regulator 1 [Araneus ventricosus]
MYRNERPGVFRHRHSSRPEKQSGFPPKYPSSFPIRRPSLFPRRRILINRFPNQGARPFRQPTSLTDYRPIGRPLMSSRYPAPRSCNNSMSKSMQQPEMPFTHSNNLEKNGANSILHTSPVLQKENFDTDYPPGVSGKDIQSPDELWIEATAPNSRVYYYSASSRVSRWDKPDNAKIINLDHIRVLANGPHIRPVQNTNIEPIYAPSNQQSHLRFFPPPQVATGIPARLFIFPPPNLNTPPPFLVRPTPTPNVPNISLFPRCSSDRFLDIPGCSSWIKKETAHSVERHPPFSSNEAALMNKPYFEDTLQNKQTSNETSSIAEQKELTAVKIHENEWDDVKIMHQAQEEQAPLNATDEYMDESKIRNSPVSGPSLNLKDETQNFTSCENDDQNSDKDNATETVIKPVDRSRPVSSTPVPGSKWSVVWTGDNRVFFYDADRKISVWEMPNELKNRSDVLKLVESPPPLIIKDKQPDKVSLSKKIKIEEEDVTELNNEDQSMDSENTESLIDAAIKKREQLPHETRVQMFLEMLSERNVSAFSTMERELHKVVFDSRYLLLPPKERKQKFDFYLRQKSEEEREARKKQVLKIKGEYKNLLQEAGVTGSTRFVDFMHQYSKDPRFKALDKLKDREVLFNEYVHSLRKKSHDLNEKRKTEFLELLKEQHYIDASINWLDVKDLLCLDHRYCSISSDYEREKLFNEYIKKNLSYELHSAKEKEDRINASIKTRKQEVQRELSYHLKELNKERENHKYDAIVNSFKALLADLVKKPDISWRGAKKILKADRRWADVCDLRDERRVQYFDEHINYLIKKKREQFRQILTEIQEITLTSKWKEVKNKVLSDPRCKLFSSDNKKCEREFKEYISDKLKEAKNEFNELLKETKIITHASKNLMETSNHLESIEKALEQDKRYLVLKCVEKERKDMLLSYIDKLHQNGPPPPPTATESIKH